MTPYSSTLHGDGPCSDCGGPNFVWFTDNVFWNAICRSDPDALEPTLCVWCFIKRAEARGARPTGWRLLPEWPWRQAPDREVEPCTAHMCEYHGTCHCACPCMPDGPDNCPECAADFAEFDRRPTWRLT